MPAACGLRIPSCRRVFCAEHTTFIDRCAECDLRLSQVEHRGIRIALIAGAVLAGGLVLSGMFLGLASLLGWLFGCSFVGALWMRHQKRLLDVRGGPLLLRGATVVIAPDAPNADPRLERSEGYGSGHSAGAMPEVPMWQRTYGGWG
jgi:hypothetical protein